MRFPGRPQEINIHMLRLKEWGLGHENKSSTTKILVGRGWVHFFVVHHTVAMTRVKGLFS